MRQQRGILTNIMLKEKPDMEESILNDSIHTKFKARLNESTALEVMMWIPFGRRGGQAGAPRS